MDGHEVFRLCQRLHQLQLLLAGVSGNVNLDHGIVQDLHILGGKLVDDASHVLFVSGNGAGGKHHQVIGIKRNLCVVGKRHAVKRRHGFSLAAGCNQRQFAWLVAFDLVDIDQYPCRNLHISQLHGGTDDVQHTSARNGDLALMPRTGIDDLLNTVNIGRECCDDDAFLLMR